MKEVNYQCPDCGDLMQVIGWSPELKDIRCPTCGASMAAMNHPREQSLTEFLKQ